MLTFHKFLSRSVSREATCIYQFIFNNHATFHLRSKENLLNHKKFSKYYEHDCLQNFLWFFMFLLTDWIVINYHISAAGIYFIFLNQRSRSNSKGFWYPIWTLVERLEKLLSSMTNFSAFLEITCSYFRLKLCQILRVKKIVKQTKL